MFLILNVKPDAVAVVQGRLKELQVSLMHEYYQLMGDMDWAVWRRELEQRREDVKNELCRGLKIKKGSGTEEYVNSFFNRSWDSLLAAIGSRTGMITTFDEAKLEAVLGRVLGSARPAYTDDSSYDFKGGGQNNGFEAIQDDGNDVLYDGIAAIDDSYDDIEELEPVDEPAGKAAPADVGARFDDIEELEPVDEPAGKAAAAAVGARFDDIEELQSPDDTSSGDSVFLENSAVLEDIPELAGVDEDTQTRADVSDSDDAAWLNLAGGTVVMDPHEIWAELTDEDEAAAEREEVTEAVEAPEKKPSLFNSDILEQDPFGEDAFDSAAESASGAADQYTTDYGEFIPSAADLSAVTAGIDPLYDVEEFIDADSESEPAFAPPGNQQNVDEIAREIEFAAVDKSIAPPKVDLNLRVRSPLKEIFFGKLENESPQASGKTAKKARGEKLRKTFETAAPAAPPQPHYSFFSQKLGDLEYIETAEDGTAASLIKKRGGVDYIDSALLKNTDTGEQNIDPKMKNLVDSVLQNR
jgi:hypothetical protein